MTLRRFNALLFTLLALLAGHLVLWLPASPLWAGTVATLTITLAVPGYWLARALLPDRARTLQERMEFALLAAGGGYVVQVLAMTLLSYTPGGITPLQTLATFDGITLALMAAGALRRKGEPTDSGRAQPATAQIVAIVALIVVVGGVFRFVDLGYSEFQGDEARAVLRAAAILQGHEETLFLHRKGPAEIVITAVGYSLTGALTESSARLPFALAGLLIPLTIFAIGWRVHSPLAGGAAALLLAIDGNFIGYGRIVQYHTIAHLMSALVILLGCRLIKAPRRLTSTLTLAALFTGAGLLSHYEVLQMGAPLLFVLWAVWRQGTAGTRLLAATSGAVVAGLLTLAIFYVPFVLNPNFTNIADYLAENLFEGEGSAPYNHLRFVFETASFYSTTYLATFLAAGLCAALLAAAGRKWGAAGVAAGAALLAAGIAGAVRPEWLTLNGTDYTVFIWLAAAGLVWLTPLTRLERLVWLWFLTKFFVVAFLTARPQLHYIPMMMPLALIVGSMMARAWEALQTRPAGRWALAGATAALAIVVTGFTYRHFVVNNVEYLREWDMEAEYGWTVHSDPTILPVFGIPHQSGWKAVGLLYAAGVLEGTYETNTRDWIAEWYTRQALRCERVHSYFILETKELPWTHAPIRAMLAESYHPIGTITVNGEPRLEVYAQGAASGETPWTVEANDYGETFDQNSTYVGLDLDTPVIEPNPEYDALVRVDEHLWLEGYDLDRMQAAAGETLRVTLYWRVRERMDEDLTVHTEVVDDAGEIEGVAQREPGCYDRPTSRWSEERLVVDHYDITVFDDAAEGIYQLVTEIYDGETGERWTFFDEEGEVLGETLDLGDVTIEAEGG